MADVGVHVELTVRLGRGVEGFHSASACRFGCCTCYVKLRCGLEWKRLKILGPTLKCDTAVIDLLFVKGYSTCLCGGGASEEYDLTNCL